MQVHLKQKVVVFLSRTEIVLQNFSAILYKFLLSGTVDMFFTQLLVTFLLRCLRPEVL